MMKNLWMYFSLLTFFVFNVSCSDDPEATGSKACFDWSPATGKVGEPVQFSNCSEDAAEYAWSVEGEVFSTEAEPSYTFTQAGDYEVKLLAGHDHSVDGVLNYIDDPDSVMMTITIAE